MKQLENKCMLITYANSMGGNLRELEEILDTYFSKELGGVHILPFYPSSGDRGFAVVNYDMVDPAFGTWEDIARSMGKGIRWVYTVHGEGMAAVEKILEECSELQENAVDTH